MMSRWQPRSLFLSSDSVPALRLANGLPSVQNNRLAPDFQSQDTLPCSRRALRDRVSMRRLGTSRGVRIPQEITISSIQRARIAGYGQKPATE